MMGVAEQMNLPHLWRRYLGLLRALIGLACLVIIAASRGINLGVFFFMLALVTVYSAIAAFWRGPEKLDRYGIFNLVLDFVFFMLCVALGGDSGFWVTSFAGFYLLLAAATLHNWREVLLITVFSLTFVIFVPPPFADRLQPLLLLLGMFGCVVALQKRALLERLSNSSRQAVLYRSEAARAREMERERVAADFHDGPMQSFIGFQMRLEILRKIMERDHGKGMEELAALQELCQKQVTEVRTFVRNMRSLEVAGGAGLATALRYVTGAFQKDSGIPAVFQANFDATHDDLEPSMDVINIVREALHNAQKHSNASRVAVRLAREDGELRLEIEDDGRGFPFAGTFTLSELEALQLGPVSIARRVRGLNGDLTLESRPGRGVSIRLRVPL